MPCFKPISVHSCVTWLAIASVEGMALCLIKPNTLYHMVVGAFLLSLPFSLFFSIFNSLLFHFFISPVMDYFSLFGFSFTHPFTSCLMSFYSDSCFVKNISFFVLTCMLFLLFDSCPPKDWFIITFWTQLNSGCHFWGHGKSIVKQPCNKICIL